jgi:hypothetical protein
MQGRRDFSKGNGERCPIRLFEGGYDLTRPSEGVGSIVQVLGNLGGLFPVHRPNPPNPIHWNKLRTL